MENSLKKLKSRWYRFIGQKTRLNNSGWTELLDSNWIGWAERTLAKYGWSIIDSPTINSKSDEIKNYYHKAINLADLQDLLRLDDLYCQDYLIKKRNR